MNSYRRTTAMFAISAAWVIAIVAMEAASGKGLSWASAYLGVLGVIPLVWGLASDEVWCAFCALFGVFGLAMDFRVALTADATGPVAGWLMAVSVLVAGIGWAIAGRSRNTSGEDPSLLTLSAVLALVLSAGTASVGAASAAALGFGWAAASYWATVLGWVGSLVFLSSATLRVASILNDATPPVSTAHNT